MLALAAILILAAAVYAAALTRTSIVDDKISAGMISASQLHADGVDSASGTGNIGFSGSRLANASDPVNPQEAATKAYVDRVLGR